MLFNQRKQKQKYSQLDFNNTARPFPCIINFKAEFEIKKN